MPQCTSAASARVERAGPGERHARPDRLPPSTDQRTGRARSRHQRPPRPRAPSPRPRAQAITPPAPHAASRLEPQAQLPAPGADLSAARVYSRVMKSASGAPMKGWHQRGTRFMDPGTECFHEIDCEADGSISMKIPDRIAGPEEGEQAACDAVISALNGQGGNWGPSEKAAGRETGVDRIAHMHGISDKRCASPEQTLRMQVTKVVRDARVFHALNTTGASTSLFIDGAVDAMRDAVSAKSLKPAGKKDDLARAGRVRRLARRGGPCDSWFSGSPQPVGEVTRLQGNLACGPARRDRALGVGRRCPTLPPRASARGLPRLGARRVQLGRDAAPGRGHQGRPLAPPLAPDSGRRLDPPPPPAAGGGPADLGPAHRRAPGKQLAVVALARRLAGHPLYAAARWQCVRAPARSVSAPSRRGRRRPHEHVNHSRRGPASATKSASVNSNGPRDSMNTY